MDISNVLEDLGLAYKEDEVYLASLELGVSSVKEIAIKAGIKRTTAYDVLSGLMSKGLIGQTQKGKKRLFYAEEPEKLYNILNEKKNRLEMAMPVLKSFYNTAGAKPKIRYYEGDSGLKTVYRDTLNYSGELLAFITENILKYLGDEFADEYMEKRKRAKLRARVIGPDTEELKEYQQNDRKGNKETKLVNKDEFPFSIEMNIYGNKIAYISFQENMGIIIESNEVANNMRLLFELAWRGIAVENNKNKP